MQGSWHKARAVLVRSFKLLDAEGKNVMIIISVSPQQISPPALPSAAQGFFSCVQCYLKFVTCSFNLERTVTPFEHRVCVRVSALCAALPSYWVSSPSAASFRRCESVSSWFRQYNQRFPLWWYRILIFLRPLLCFSVQRWKNTNHHLGTWEKIHAWRAWRTACCEIEGGLRSPTAGSTIQ